MNMTTKHQIIKTFNRNQQPPQDKLNRHSQKLFYWFFENEPLIKTAKRLGVQLGFKVVAVSGSMYNEPFTS